MQWGCLREESVTIVEGPGKKVGMRELGFSREWAILTWQVGVSRVINRGGHIARVGMGELGQFIGRKLTVRVNKMGFSRVGNINMIKG